MPKLRYRLHVDGTSEQISAPALPSFPSVSRGTPSADYMRGDNSPFFFNWWPSLRDPRDDVRMGYVRAAARAIDSIQNSGWLAGAIDHSVAAVLGDGLRLASKPDADALGWDKKTADAWARTVERKFETWSCSPVECDAEGKHTLGQLGGAIVRSYFAYGEALGLVPMVRRQFSKTQTKVKVLPANKLAQDSNGVDMYQGVVMQDWGFPVAYRIWLPLPQKFAPAGGMFTEYPVNVPARDAIGRPQVFHVFEGAAGQMRGITPLAPALRVVRQFDNLSDNTAQAALIHSIFAATVQSEAPTDQILNALRDEDEQGVGGGSIDGLLAAKTQWYQNTKIDLGRGGKIAHLFPGEKLDFLTSKSPNENYEAFAKFLLREIARCIGVTFETLTGDYTGATYSSVRMATSELWPITLRRRKNIAAPVYQIVYEAWLEEAIETGDVPFPGGVDAFLANRASACRADWRGPAKPQADDLKTAKAHEVYKRLGTVSDEQVCAELGTDWEDVYEQRAREKAKREELGLPETDTLAPPDEEGDTPEKLDNLDR